MSKLTIVNPGDRDCTRHSFILWFGAYGETHLLAYANSLDDALEECGAWIVDHAPGLLADEAVAEAYDEAYRDARAFGALHEQAQEYAWDKSAEDMTSLDGGHWLASWEWGIVAEDPERAQIKEYEEIEVCR